MKRQRESCTFVMFVCVLVVTAVSDPLARAGDQRRVRAASPRTALEVIRANDDGVLTGAAGPAQGESVLLWGRADAYAFAVEEVGTIDLHELVRLVRLSGVDLSAGALDVLRRSPVLGYARGEIAVNEQTETILAWTISYLANDGERVHALVPFDIDEFKRSQVRDWVGHSDRPQTSSGESCAEIAQNHCGIEPNCDEEGGAGITGCVDGAGCRSRICDWAVCFNRVHDNCSNITAETFLGPQHACIGVHLLEIAGCLPSWLWG